MSRTRTAFVRRLVAKLPAHGRQNESERGQALVVFVLALTGIIAAVGLVLDGGDAFAQRRSEQNAADLAALAGANDYLVNGDGTSATTAAKASASGNGYTDGAGGVTRQRVVRLHGRSQDSRRHLGSAPQQLHRADRAGELDDRRVRDGTHRPAGHRLRRRSR